MVAPDSALASSHAPRGSFFLIVGILLSVLTEAIASTALALGRADIIGDTAATPDEFAQLDFGYTTAKMIGFLVAASVMRPISPPRLLASTTLFMGVASAAACLTTNLDALVLLRILQGFCGGILLVAGQAILFIAYRRSWQPSLQAIFALGAVVAPATVAPALQGWLIDSRSWIWIFSCNIPLALASAGFIVACNVGVPAIREHKPFDWPGFLLISFVLFCFTYVLSQGQRWNWVDEPRIVFLSAIGTAASAGFVFQQTLAGKDRLIDLTPFHSEDFLFAFIVSFVAGAALFGSAFLIPSFAVSILSFTPTEAGLLLLPSSVLFAGSLLLAAFLMQKRGVPPFATVPIGIVALMIAMWMLSGSTGESGVSDMRTAILLRGLGLGFLFLSITLIAFNRLRKEHLATGIGLFNTGRQMGGLIGVALLQTIIDRSITSNNTVLAAGVSALDPATISRLTQTATQLSAKGMDMTTADRVAVSLLGRSLVHQSSIIAFDTAFNAVALMFLFAAPVLIAIKLGLARRAETARRVREAIGC